MTYEIVTRALEAFAVAIIAGPAGWLLYRELRALSDAYDSLPHDDELDDELEELLGE